jgi:apolipoprotein N-acyltransferase
VRDYLLLSVAAFVLAVSWLDERYWGAAWLGMFGYVWGTFGWPGHLAFRRGLYLGTVAILTAFHWVPDILHQTLSLSYANCLLLFFILSLWDGFQFALVPLLVRRLTHVPWQAALLYPLFWIALESVWPRIFPWRLGHSQIAWTSLIQIGEFAGPYGVGFILLWGAAIAGIFVRLWWSRSPITPNAPRALGREAAVFAGVLLLVLGFGHWRWRDLERIAAAAPTTKVCIVQVNVYEDDALNQLQDLSADVEPGTDLILWPETSVGAYDLDLTDFRSPNKVLLASRNDGELIEPLPDPPCALLCVGKCYAHDAPEHGPYFVTAFLLDRQENIIGRYHKRTLLPVGEYMPGESWFPQLAKLALLSQTIARGKSAAILTLPATGAKLGCLICYEDMIDNRARESTQAGADILVSLINGAAFGDSLAMRQHQQLAYFRALENRRFHIRCSSTGVSSVISATGRVIAELPPGENNKITVVVPAMSTTTVYSQWGNVFTRLCLLIAAGLMFKAWWSKPG